MLLVENHWPKGIGRVPVLYCFLNSESAFQVCLGILKPEKSGFELHILIMKSLEHGFSMSTLGIVITTLKNDSKDQKSYARTPSPMLDTEKQWGCSFFDSVNIHGAPSAC